jgi:hypothetical protein
LPLDAGRVALLQVHAQCQIGLPGGQRLQRAGQRLVADAQPRRRVERKKCLGQLHQDGPRDDAVRRNGELRLPAGRHTLHAVGHRVNLIEQARAFAQQFLASLGQAGLARTMLTLRKSQDRGYADHDWLKSLPLVLVRRLL